jgi:hypothetical protein
LAYVPPKRRHSSKRSHNPQDHNMRFDIIEAWKYLYTCYI